jgi:two-component system nitrogen regulation response regulator NtrX
MPQSASVDVLVLEDETAIADALIEILGVEGYRVRAAATVQEARELIAARTPALVLLDFMLAAGATSETLLVELLGWRSPPAMLVYSATSAALPVARRHGVRFLSKPFDLDVLLSTLRELLGGGDRGASDAGAGIGT